MKKSIFRDSITKILENIHYGFFLILLVIGIVIINDYNIASDEPINRSNGGVSANAINNKLNNAFGTTFFQKDEQFKEFNTDLNTYFDRDYGVVFDLPIFYIERIFNINKAKSQYILRHGVNFLIFILGLIAFYRIAILRFQNKYVGLIAVIMLAISPRIFPDAFYNYKDILFLSIITIAVYSMIETFKKPSIFRILMHALITGIAIDVRILGVIIFVGTISLIIIKLFKKELTFIQSLKFVSVYFLGSIFFTIAFWPWLWVNPFKFNLWHIPYDRFIEAFSNMSKFRWEGLILFNGNYYPADKLPRSYLPVWILISTPLLYIILFIIGVVKIIKDQLDLKLQLWKSDESFYDLIFISIFSTPIISILILKSVVYDGWRQIYFIYPFLILISIVGLTSIYNIINNYIYLKRLLTISLVLYIGNITLFMYKNHPYQMVYFNELISTELASKFEMDYWGISTKEALQEILLNDQNSEIKVYSLGNTTVPQTLLFLGPEFKNRILITDDYNEADYVLYNHRIISYLNMPILKDVINKRKVFYQVISDNKSLFTVYK